MIEMFPVTRSLSESDRTSDYVAIANLHNGHIPQHSAIIIQHQENRFLFHYTGYAIEYSEVNDEYFHRITDTITPEEIPSFIAMCKNIHSKANPIYGYFYSGESYDIHGSHLSDNDSGERMTCVGFCLNVLKGFLEDDYIQYADWTEESHEEEGYLEKYCKKHNLEIESIRASHRRISPRECLSSAFFTRLPIRKVQIDNKVNELNGYFQRLFGQEEE